MKTSPTRSRAEVAADRRTLRESMRTWFDDRRAAAEKRAKKARKQTRRSRALTSRGVDRVPARYRVDRPEPEWVHRHDPTPRGLFGRPRRMTPYVNPDRDTKRHARLRKDLQS